MNKKILENLRYKFHENIGLILFLGAISTSLIGGMCGLLYCGRVQNSEHRERLIGDANVVYNLGKCTGSDARIFQYDLDTQKIYWDICLNEELLFLEYDLNKYKRIK